MDDRKAHGAGSGREGASEGRAEEVAARTVNKERARSGESRARSRTSTNDMSSSRRGGQRSGTNRPEGRSRDQLYNEALQLGIDGRSKMNKAQLERAVERQKGWPFDGSGGRQIAAQQHAATGLLIGLGYNQRGQGAVGEFVPAARPCFSALRPTQPSSGNRRRRAKRSTPA